MGFDYTPGHTSQPPDAPGPSRYRRMKQSRDRYKAEAERATEKLAHAQQEIAELKQALETARGGYA